MASRGASAGGSAFAVDGAMVTVAPELITCQDSAGFRNLDFMHVRELHVTSSGLGQGAPGGVFMQVGRQLPLSLTIGPSRQLVPFCL